MLAQSAAAIPAGQFKWLRFALDGGASGADADLTLTGNPNDYWRLVALTIMP